VYVNNFIKISNIICVSILIIFSLTFTGCKSAILSAPDTATLLLSVSPGTITQGGQATVRVVGFKSSGTPVPDGTVIFFFTDLGSIEASKETKGGVAEALFTSSDNRSGVATITVRSGNAESTPDAVSISIGASALYTITVSADPIVLPIGGGTSLIRTIAYDESQNPLANIPVIFTTDKGRLDSKGSPVMTDNNGIAEDRLFTEETAEVTASSGELAATLTISVTDNQPPTALFVYSPSSPKIGEKVFFNGEGSTDSDSEFLSYEWDFGDGNGDSGKKVDHKYKALGTYTVILTVQDNHGNRSTVSQTVTVSQGEAPTASFIYSPTSPGIDETIYFNAEASGDDDSTNLSYQWDFGDGNSDSGKTVTHAFSSAGTYRVQLLVTDDDGNSDTVSQDISIGDNKNPVASFTFSPTSPRRDEPVYFNATDSYDPEGDTLTYSWDFGDGTGGSGSMPNHTYTNTGTFTVHLQVTDSIGASNSTTRSVTVSADQSPTASFVYSPSNPSAGEDVFFNATASSDPEGGQLTYAWDFGDGSNSTAETVTHAYTTAGTYTVVLEVTDDKGNTSSISKTITVS
jgi:PKD repeat protein